jgi:hypothetical protein
MLSAANFLSMLSKHSYNRREALYLPRFQAWIKAVVHVISCLISAE